MASKRKKDQCERDHSREHNQPSAGNKPMVLATSTAQHCRSLDVLYLHLDPFILFELFVLIRACLSHTQNTNSDNMSLFQEGDDSLAELWPLDLPPPPPPPRERPVYRGASDHTSLPFANSRHLNLTSACLRAQVQPSVDWVSVPRYQNTLIFHVSVFSPQSAGFACTHWRCRSRQPFGNWLP